MKKFATLLTVLMVMVLCATPVFAADPPDIEVDIDILIPGDADVSVDITAGGDVSLWVDGYDLDEVAGTAYSASQGVYDINSRGSWNAYDVSKYVAETLAPIIAALQSHNIAVGILSSAQAKLITEKQITDSNLLYAVNQIEALDGKTAVALTAQEAVDAMIWDQLMNGAEYHIALQDIELGEHESAIAANEANVSNLEQRLETAEQYNSELTAWAVSEVQRLDYERAYMEWRLNIWLYILGGASLLLIAGMISMIATRRR